MTQGEQLTTIQWSAAVPVASLITNDIVVARRWSRLGYRLRVRSTPGVGTARRHWLATVPVRCIAFRRPGSARAQGGCR